ncbi:MAG: hypothetical protein ABI876_10230 [Bacteroidota bacterium]
MRKTAKRFATGCLALAGAVALMMGAGTVAHAQYQGLYGGANADAAEGGIIPTGDGEYIAVGYTFSLGTDQDVYVVKTNRCGQIVWSHAYNFGGFDIGRKIRETRDGNYVIVGTTENLFSCTNVDAFLMQIDRDGNVMWANTYGGRSKDLGQDVQIDPDDDNLYFCGQSASFGAGGYDGWIGRTDPNGNLLWSRVYGGESDDLFNSLALSCNGTVSAAGSTRSATSVGDEQVYVLQASRANGFPLWSQHYGRNRDESAWSIVSYRDDILFVAGRTNEYGGPNQGYVLGLRCGDGAPIGDLAVYGANLTGDDQFTEIQVLPTGNLIMTGFLQDAPQGLGRYDVHLFEMTPAFVPVLTRVYGRGGDEQGWSVAVTRPIFPTQPYGLIQAGWSENSFHGLGGRDLYEILSDNGGKSGCNETKPAIRWQSPKFEPERLPTCWPMVDVQCRARVAMLDGGEARLLCTPCVPNVAPDEDPSFSQRVPSMNGDGVATKALNGHGETFLSPRR